MQWGGQSLAPPDPSCAASTCGPRSSSERLNSDPGLGFLPQRPVCCVDSGREGAPGTVKLAFLYMVPLRRWMTAVCRAPRGPRQSPEEWL